jgi:hypothetical protein
VNFIPERPRDRQPSETRRHSQLPAIPGKSGQTDGLHLAGNAEKLLFDIREQAFAGMNPDLLFHVNCLYPADDRC